MNDKTTSGNPPPSGKLTPYEWQRAILASDLPSTTKLVLMALSTHINKETGLAFPSIRTLMKETSLGSEAVVKHIGDAKKAGWIEIGNHGYQDQRWARKSYRPRIPVNLKEGVSPSKTPYDIGVSPSKTPYDIKGVSIERKGVSIERKGVSIEPPFQEAEIAPEAAPAVAYSDPPAAPNNILTREKQEREREGEIPPSTPPDSLSVSLNSSQRETTQTAGENPEAPEAERKPCPNDPIPANGKLTTGRKRQHQGNGAGQPLPTPLTLSDDEIEAAMREIGFPEAEVKAEASKFRDNHRSRGTLSCDWQAELRIWKQRRDEWRSREREHVRTNGKVEKTMPRPPVFVAEPKAQIDPSKPRPS